MVRHLIRPWYDDWVKNAKDGEDGPDTYTWQEGIPP
jgi:hypothetical protein